MARDVRHAGCGGPPRALPRVGRAQVDIVVVMSEPHQSGAPGDGERYPYGERPYQPQQSSTSHQPPLGGAAAQHPAPPHLPGQTPAGRAEPADPWQPMPLMGGHPGQAAHGHPGSPTAAGAASGQPEAPSATRIARKVAGYICLGLGALIILVGVFEMLSMVTSGRETVGYAIGTSIAAAIFGVPFLILGIFLMPRGARRR